MGWIMGPGILMGALSVGAAFVMMEGGFDHPAPDRLWRLVDELGITHLGLAPTIIRLLAGHGEKWVEPYDLESLRVLGSTGEPMTVPAWRWLHRHVGRGTRPIINISGGTEVGGAILTGNPIVESPAGTFAGPSLGMAAEVFDADGHSVAGELGELVVTAPWPAMTWGFWQEPDRYIETYWSRWPDVWVHGDRAVIRDDGAWELPGRSDDLMKVAGKRIGPAEYESLATEVEGVLAAAAVGLPNPIKGEVAVVVVLPNAGADAEEVARRVDERITGALGKPMRPWAVLPVTDIPLTRSAKVHRRAVRGWLAGVDPGDLSNVENPASQEAIEAAAARLPADAEPAP
jgi:acetyl-CoA synthetase